MANNKNILKAVDLRKDDEKKLNAKLLDLKQEAFNLRMQKAELEKTHRIKEVRRSIAVVNTVLNEKRKANA